MRVIRTEKSRPLTLLALNAHGMLAAGSWVSGAGGNVELWSAATGTHQFTHLVPDQEPHSLVFAPDGRTVVVGEWKRIAVIDATAHTVSHGPDVRHAFPECVFTPAGEMIFAETYSGRARLVCYADASPAGRVKWELTPRDGFANFRSPAIDHTGRVLAVFETAIGPRGTGSEIQFRDAATGAVRNAIRVNGSGRLLGFTFTADGSKLLVRGDSRKVQLFDSTTGARAGELVHPGRSHVTGVAAHPRGFVACARTDGTVTFWGVNACEPLRTLDWKAGRLWSLTFSPDGALAAAGTEGGKIVVWDVDA